MAAQAKNMIQCGCGQVADIIHSESDRHVRQRIVRLVQRSDECHVFISWWNSEFRQAQWQCMGVITDESRADFGFRSQTPTLSRSD